MQTFDESMASGTDPISAIRQYPLVILAFALAFGTFGAWFAANRPPTFATTAGIVVEDARSSSLFDSRSRDAERYVADQVAILRSAVVAELASALALTLEPSADFSPRDFGVNLTIASSPESNLIEISFSADDPLRAQAGANAIGSSYQEIIGEALAEDARTAIDRLDDAIKTTVAEIAALQTQVEELRSDNNEQVKLDNQLDEIVSELVALRTLTSDPLGNDPGSELEAIQEVTARAIQLSEELNARLLVTQVEAQLPATSVLLRQQRDAAALLSELTLRRSEIEVDAQLAGNGVAFFAPAARGVREGISASSAVLVSGVLGALIGSGVAFWLSQRRQHVEDRLAPRNILGSPLLVDVPGMPTRLPIPTLFRRLLSRDEGRHNLAPLPVLEDPTSARADAFRILAGALLRQRLEWLDDTSQSAISDLSQSRGMIISCVSASSRDANAVVAVNVALAAGQTGMNVALVDGDVVGQDVSRLMQRIRRIQRFGETAGVRRVSRVRGSQVGLVDVMGGTKTLDDAMVRIDVGDGNDVSFLAVGGVGSYIAPDLFGSQTVPAIFRQLADQHDLVVMSLPPVLEAAHATAIQQTDRALIVVPHGTSVRHLKELRHRMEIMAVPMAGYAYMGPPERGRVAKTTPAVAQLINPHIENEDLTRITGIGPVVQELLYSEGITTLEHLAATAPFRLWKILGNAGRQFAYHDPSDWPSQAALEPSDHDTA